MLCLHQTLLCLKSSIDVKPTPPTLPPSECFYGDVQLIDNVTTVLPTFTEIRGIVEVCDADGRYTPLCSFGRVQYDNLSRLFDVMCSQIGYDG